MADISFVDDSFRLADCYIKRDYSQLAKEIIDEKDKLSYYEKHGDKLAGYSIVENSALSKLYDSSFYVVKFFFANVNTLHEAEQYNLLRRLFEQLKKMLNNNKGYYNIRIPSHIVDVLKAYNMVFQEGYFCGGTVEEIIYGKTVEKEVNDNINVFQCDMQYVNEHRRELLNMTYESFSTYQGQYHISPVTDDKAGRIYENWMEACLNLCDGKNIVVAEINEKPVGYTTIEESEKAVEGILTAVDKMYRRCGAYRAIISYIVNYASAQDKSFSISTQFDNFIVQGVWNSIGLKPYYSLYNFHIDKR